MNATVTEINKSFAELLAQRGVYRKLCHGNNPDRLRRMYYLVNTVRKKLRDKKQVTIDLKLRWLIKSGWRPCVADLYTTSEVVALIDRAIKMNKQARAMGGAFVLEQLQLAV
jgi:hypothetical protein